jgi:hypothetical protein
MVDLAYACVEDEDQPDTVLRDQPRRPEEEAGQVRRDAALRVLERRTVAEADEREKLVQLAVRVYRERPAVQLGWADRLRPHNRSQHHTHRAPESSIAFF